MPSVTRYLTVDGEILSEKRGAAKSDYLPDPLGSTAALLNSSQTKTDSYTYWPYGEERTSSGSTPTPFRYVGTLGYRKDDSSRTYVRARVLNPGRARWMTMDPLWPRQSAYGYCYADPIGATDMLGLACGYDCNKPCANGAALGASTGTSGSYYDSLPGYTYCCDGRLVSCLNRKWPGDPDADQPPMSDRDFYECVLAHENAHKNDPKAKCPPNGLGSPIYPPGYQFECVGYSAEIACYEKKFANCGKIKNTVEREKCYKKFDSLIEYACGMALRGVKPPCSYGQLPSICLLRR